MDDRVWGGTESQENGKKKDEKPMVIFGAANKEEKTKYNIEIRNNANHLNNYENFKNNIIDIAEKFIPKIPYLTSRTINLIVFFSSLES